MSSAMRSACLLDSSPRQASTAVRSAAPFGSSNCSGVFPQAWNSAYASSPFRTMRRPSSFPSTLWHRGMLLEEQVVVVQSTPGQLFLTCRNVSRHSNNMQMVTQAHRGACPCKPFNEISCCISRVDAQGDHASLFQCKPYRDSTRLCAPQDWTGKDQW